MIRNLLVQLWKDEAGALIATEYLLLGSVVTVGSVSGMTAMRDAVTDEYKEFGTSVREIRQAHTPANLKPKAPRAAAGYSVAPGAYDGSDAAPTAPQVTFAAP